MTRRFVLRFGSGEPPAQPETGLLFPDSNVSAFTNKMIPTYKTRAMMPKIQFHLSGLRAAVQAENEFDPAQVDSVFTVGFRDVLESIVFPALVHQISSEAPRIKMVSRRVRREEVERELVSGSIDLLIDRGKHTDNRIRNQYLGDETLVVAMRADHPLVPAGLYA